MDGQALQPTAAQSQIIENLVSQPEHIQASPGSSASSGLAGHDANSQVSSTTPLRPAPDSHLAQPDSHENYPESGQDRVNPAANNYDAHVTCWQSLMSFLGFPVRRQKASVPEHTKCTSLTIGKRLEPTIESAMSERDKYVWRGRRINIAIGLQVILGALTTAIAAAVTNARQAQISTAILGGFTTVVASYLVRTRGLGEPELSIMRLNDLDQFLRECRSFRVDHSHKHGDAADHVTPELQKLRWRLEELLGNKPSLIGTKQSQPTP